MRAIALTIISLCLSFSLWGANPSPKGEILQSQFLNHNLRTEGAKSMANDRVLVKIVGEDSQALPQAYLKVLSTKKVYVADNQGLISLKLRKSVEVEVSYISYISKRIWIKVGMKNLKIVLKEDKSLLNAGHIRVDRTKNSHTSLVQNLAKESLNMGQNKSLASLLSSISGCRTLSSGANIEKPIIEGMSGSRIAIINNGTKISGQNWSDDHAPEISISPYAKVSVIKGAEGVRYGANAISGVIIVNTDLNPLKKKDDFSILTTYSTNSSLFGLNTYWESSLRNIPGLRYRLSYKGLISRDYHTPTYRLANTASRLSNFNFDLAYLRGSLSLNSHLTIYNNQLGIFRGIFVASLEDMLKRYSLQRPPASALPKEKPYEILNPQQKIQHLTYNLKLVDIRRNLSLSYSFQKDYRREYSLRLGRFKNEPDFAFKLYSHDINLEHKLNFHESLNLQSGLSFNLRKNVSDRNTGAVPIIPNYVAENFALYSLGHYNFAKKSFLELGLRSDFSYSNAIGYNIQAKTYGGIKKYFALSTSTGIRSNYFDNQEFSLNASLAWRAPDMNELYSYGLHHGEAIFQQGDPNLKTEKAFKLNASYEFRQRNFRFLSHLFCSYIIDYIYDSPRYHWVDNKWEAIGTLQNSGYFVKYFYSQTNALFVGGDMRADLYLGAGFSTTASVDILRARDFSKSMYLPHIPADRFRFSLNYKKKISAWDFNAEMIYDYVAKQRYRSEEVDLLPDSPPAYYLLSMNMNLSYRFPSASKLTFSVVGTNLLNRLYKDYTNRLYYFVHEKAIDFSFSVGYSF